MTTTTSFSERLSEKWLIERTYHAELLNGKELSVPDFTEAMKQLIDFAVPLSSQSGKSKLAERLPTRKSSNFYVPLSTWKEISQEEAHATAQRGIPVLLYGEHPWEHLKGATGAWSPNRNIRGLIYGKVWEQREAASGTNSAVCYLDPKQGMFSNASWKAWFSSDTTTSLDGSSQSNITFLGPCMQFPYTTHYTVITSHGQVLEYADRAGAIQGFHTLPPQQMSHETDLQTIFPQFCYYHEIVCLSGVYRLEFFGPGMDEQGYKVKE
jgi:hypothetical protein